MQVVKAKCVGHDDPHLQIACSNSVAPKHFGLSPSNTLKLLRNPKSFAYVHCIYQYLLNLKLKLRNT